MNATSRAPSSTTSAKSRPAGCICDAAAPACSTTRCANSAYSDAAAGRRIGAVRLCADQPDARERLRDGSLTLSAAAELQWAFDRQRRRGSITGIASIAPTGTVAPGAAAARADLPGSAPMEAPTVGGGALGAAPAEVASADDPVAAEPAPPLVLDAAGRQKLVEEAAGKSTRQVRRMLADLDPELAPPADRVRPLGDGRYELKAVIDADCHQGLEQLRGLLSHVDPRMTLGQLVGRIVQEALDHRHDPSRPPRRARAGSRPADGDSKPTSASEEQATPEPGHAVTAPDAATPAGATPAPERTRQPTPTSARSPSRQGATDRRAAAGRKPTRAATPAAKSRVFGPVDSGGGETTGLAEGRGPLQLRRSRDRTPLQLTTSDRDRPHPAVCAGRRRRSRKPQARVPSPSPPSAPAA